MRGTHAAMDEGGRVARVCCFVVKPAVPLTVHIARVSCLYSNFADTPLPCLCNAMQCIVGSVYAMTKAAIIQLTKNLACEWARSGVTVNSVAPWMTMTPLLREAVATDPGQLEKVGGSNICIVWRTTTPSHTTTSHKPNKPTWQGNPPS